jgi:hypothetical protein
MDVSEPYKVSSAQNRSGSGDNGVLTRYFAPFNPIPVAPIGWYFFSPYGLTVSAVELLLFAPLLWYGVYGDRPGAPSGRRRPGKRLAVVWIIAVLLLLWRGEARDNAMGYLVGEDVEFWPPPRAGDPFSKGSCRVYWPLLERPARA